MEFEDSVCFIELLDQFHSILAETIVSSGLEFQV